MKLLAAQAQGMYWFLVMRADLGIERNDLAGAARAGGSARRPGSTSASSSCSSTRGVDLDEVEIAPVPGRRWRGDELRPDRGARPRRGQRSTASGPTGWAPRWPSARAPARSSSTSAAATGPTAASTTRSPRWRRPRRCIAADPVAAQARRPRPAPRPGAARRGPRARDRGRRAALPGRAGGADRRAGRAATSPSTTRRSRERAVSGMNRFARERGLLAGDPAYEQIVAPARRSDEELSTRCQSTSSTTSSTRSTSTADGRRRPATRTGIKQKILAGALDEEADAGPARGCCASTRASSPPRRSSTSTGRRSTSSPVTSPWATTSEGNGGESLRAAHLRLPPARAPRTGRSSPRRGCLLLEIHYFDPV